MKDANNITNIRNGGSKTLARHAAGSPGAEKATAENENPSPGISVTRVLLKSIKNVLFAVYLYSGYTALRDMVLSLVGRSRAVVLYYHRLGDSADPMTRSLDDFRTDLAYLERSYECISLAELCRRLRSGVAFRGRAVVITFDDGYRDNYTKAVPLLKEAGLTATFFVATGYINTDRAFPHDERRDGPDAARAKLTWDDLRAMQADGFDIGSHTVNHTNLGHASYEVVKSELSESLAALDRELGIRSRAFSFPWGKPEDISKEAIAAAREAGYYSVSSAYGGSNSRRSDPFNIQRVDAGNGAFNALAFKARVAGLAPDFFRVGARSLMIIARRVLFGAGLLSTADRQVHREGN